jgi:hypothetical protein
VSEHDQLQENDDPVCVQASGKKFTLWVSRMDNKTGNAMTKWQAQRNSEQLDHRLPSG